MSLDFRKGREKRIAFQACLLSPSFFWNSIAASPAQPSPAKAKANHKKKLYANARDLGSIDVRGPPASTINPPFYQAPFPVNGPEHSKLNTPKNPCSKFHLWSNINPELVSMEPCMIRVIMLRMH